MSGNDVEAVASDTYPHPAHGWTCFHCGETFHASGLAEAHFGHHVDGEPACRLNRKERGLAFQLREAEQQLERYRMEDSNTDRAMHAMRADHAVALIREEEKGYAKALADIRAQGWQSPEDAQAAIAALNVPALEAEVASERTLKEGYYDEAAKGWQKVRALEARIKELEADAVQWQQSRDWFALKCIALRDKLKQFNVEDDEIMEVTRRAASALGDQHER